jgi:short-subunit dehydrogenase
MTHKKVVLITGASTGIGRAIADHLAGFCFMVFGTSRRPAGYEPPRGWDLVELDVRSDESAARCVEVVLDRAKRIDVLINNAGYGIGGAAEEATLDQVRAEFETNFFGLVRMTKAVLPSMRRQVSGNIINISSGNAAVRLPFSSYYVASKCAVEGFSACLRRELRPLGVYVSVIEPTFLKSQISETIQMGGERIDAYEPWKTRWQEAIKRSVRHAAAPDLVAKCVVRILSSRKPRCLYLVGPGLRLARWSKRWLPEDLFYWGMGKALRVRGK